MGMEILTSANILMSDEFQPISYRSDPSNSDQMHQQQQQLQQHQQHQQRQANVTPSINESNSATHLDQRQNDYVATEIRRMQRVREEENNALMQLLSRQQQMNAAAGSNSSPQFNGMANSSNLPFGSSQMNNFMSQSLMNNRDVNNMSGIDSINSMNNSMRMNNTNGALGSQLNNFMSSSFMNSSMNMNGLDNMGTNQASLNNIPSATTTSPSSQFNKSDLPFDQQPSNFMAQSLMNNNQNNSNMESLVMNDLINKNQLMMGGLSAAYMPPTESNQQQAVQEDLGWEEQFKALRAYQLRFGNCKVPARYKANPKLGRWVMTQRRQFTLLMQGFPSALTAERIRRLESVGFTWSVRPEPVSTWNKKFQELKAYKATYGNCMVPQRYQANSQLGTWVHTQRRQYKLMTEGKKSSMTKEKAEALDSIGFFWAAKTSTSSANSNDSDSGSNKE
mmetsp:Transcript_24709/g.42269  ORF Transcript_24709/g.42269 Transcript_24709/m.42269 type:complete len:449 (-) Transcript_24709:164-1510(-)